MRTEFLQHLKKQYEFRVNYQHTRSKNWNIVQNLSKITDGGGSAGLVACPRPARVSKDMPARHEMMKMKVTFTKLHGKGLVLDINFPNIEKMGTNLTIDIIISNILFYLEHSNQRFLANVYMQFDNVNSNKGMLIFGVCAALILAGIVKKIKISYLLVGHTHDDVDAAIGTAATALRPVDVYSISSLKDILETALSGLKVLGVRVNMGTLNYEGLKDLIKEACPSNIPVTQMRQVLYYISQQIYCVFS